MMREVFDCIRRAFLLHFDGKVHLEHPPPLPFQEDKWYRLTSQFQGDDKSLDVINDGKNNQLQLGKTGQFSGQYWKITVL